MSLETMAPISGERGESEEDSEGEGKVVGVVEVVGEVCPIFFVEVFGYSVGF